MKVKAAVMNEYGKPLTIEEVDLSEPQQGEVLVKLVATGVCHSDMSAWHGWYGSPLPTILGHEGGGIVEAVGPGVTKLQKGDQVLLSVASGCGQCAECIQGRPFLCAADGQNSPHALRNGSKHFSRGGADVHYMLSQSSFAEYTVVMESTAVKVPSDVPLDVLAPLGCGQQTGAGAVLNIAKVGLGDKVAIFGCGGLGLAAIMAANVERCSPIIAIDVIDSRLELARELGATHVINAAKENPVLRVVEITGGGADYSFEFVGREDTICNTVNCLRRYGTAVISGAPPLGSEVKLNALRLLMVNIMGNVGGKSIPDVFLPKLVDLWRQGLFPVERLIGKTYTLDQVNQAFADMADGSVVKPVIKF